MESEEIKPKVQGAVWANVSALNVVGDPAVAGHGLRAPEGGAPSQRDADGMLTFSSDLHVPLTVCHLA